MTDVAMTDDLSFSLSSGILIEKPFTPNGLLAENVEVLLHGEDSQNQEDHLPSLSQLLPQRPKKPLVVTACLESHQTDFMDQSSPLESSSFLPTSRVPIKATSFEGKSVFFSRRRRTFPTRNASIVLFESLGPMLEVPTHRLMEQLSATTANLSLAQMQNASKSNKIHNSSPDSELWVDRYRPRRFLDLLGDERVHRETLSWVKEWDFCVFGKKRKGKQRSTVNEMEPGNYYEDEYHRPREKILLLSGPPGLGKTTLAHVVAAQAGYQVMEINASDARSGQVVDERIRPALESGAAVGSKKPTLLVVDEIDGATGGGDNSSGFVQKLLQLISEKPKRKTRAKERHFRPLLRPVIAICNDLYASSLSRLRQHARIVRFNRPADVHLVKRLRDICEFEKLRVDSRALSALVGIAQGDMRGCLNTLQFIKNRNQEVTEHVVRTATAGMKEADTSLISVLGDLFSPLPKRRVRELGLTEAQEAKYVGRLSRDVETSGSLDKLVIGCFEHFPNLHMHDMTFQRYEHAHEWLSMFDMFSSTMRSEKEYALMPYLPYSLVPFYPLFAERGGEKPQRPKADWENHVKTKTNEEIYRSLAKGGVSGQSLVSKTIVDYKNLLTGDVLKLEFLPLLNRIISPPLRPVNSHLIRPEERALMKRLVNIMVSLQLRFVQEKTEDGSLVYTLDPPIDVFVTYDGKRAADIPISRYAVRHLVAAEIDAELILRQAEAVEKHQTNKSDFFFKSRQGMDQIIEEELASKYTSHGGSKRPGVSRKRTFSDEKVDPVDKPPTDFFGRAIVLPVAVGLNQPDSAEPIAKKCKVVYRFKEGNSSAVRKPVKMEAFL